MAYAPVLFVQTSISFKKYIFYVGNTEMQSSIYLKKRLIRATSLVQYFAIAKLASFVI